MPGYDKMHEALKRRLEARKSLEEQYETTEDLVRAINSGDLSAGFVRSLIVVLSEYAGCVEAQLRERDMIHPLKVQELRDICGPKAAHETLVNTATGVLHEVVYEIVESIASEAFLAGVGREKALAAVLVATMRLIVVQAEEVDEKTKAKQDERILESARAALFAARESIRR